MFGTLPYDSPLPNQVKLNYPPIQQARQIAVNRTIKHHKINKQNEQCQENAKGADLSRSTSKARNLRNSRSERTEEQIQQQNTDARVRMAQLHQEEPEDTRAERNEVRRLEQQQSRRFTVNRRRTNDQQRQQVHRAFISDSFLRLAFQYEPDIEYYAHSKVVIGAMDKECPHCHALKFKNEPAGMCCASGKVQLPEIETPPEPLNGLLIGTDQILTCS
ncbi:ATP-dependent DNA helicase [Trichonephila clavipes]|nr:ATP-dependent DNA helicase [Trichonephila clavipes]